MVLEDEEIGLRSMVLVGTLVESEGTDMAVLGIVESMSAKFWTVELTS